MKFIKNIGLRFWSIQNWRFSNDAEHEWDTEDGEEDWEIQGMKRMIQQMEERGSPKSRSDLMKQELKEAEKKAIVGPVKAKADAHQMMVDRMKIHEQKVKWKEEKICSTILSNKKPGHTNNDSSLERKWQHLV